MTRAVLADSGPLYAAVDEGDEHHFEAHRALETLARDRRNVVISYPILLEGYSLVLYRLGGLEVNALPHLPSPNDLVLRRREFRQRKRAATVEFLGADAHFGAEAEFRAVGEAGRGVPVDGGRIHAA
jgi:predicted nucleic acid-binding protein